MKERILMPLVTIEETMEIDNQEFQETMKTVLITSSETDSRPRTKNNIMNE